MGASCWGIGSRHTSTLLARGLPCPNALTDTEFPQKRCVAFSDLAGRPVRGRIAAARGGCASQHHEREIYGHTAVREWLSPKPPEETGADTKKYS